jgi:hypothetical protein
MAAPEPARAREESKCLRARGCGVGSGTVAENQENRRRKEIA